MKKIVLAALLISANTLADAGDIVGDFYVLCEPVKNVNTMEMDLVNGGFLKKAPEGARPFEVYLDASEMDVILGLADSYFLCDAFKSSELYVLSCSGYSFRNDIIQIDRTNLRAWARLYDDRSGRTPDEYQCKKLPIEKDVKI